MTCTAYVEQTLCIVPPEYAKAYNEPEIDIKSCKSKKFFSLRAKIFMSMSHADFPALSSFVRVVVTLIGALHIKFSKIISPTFFDLESHQVVEEMNLVAGFGMTFLIVGVRSMIVNRLLVPRKMAEVRRGLLILSAMGLIRSAAIVSLAGVIPVSGTASCFHERS